jgi:TP901-1 family phage major tail protein
LKGTKVAAQKGRALLLKIDSDGAGSFATVAGLRSKSIALNAAMIDVTNADSPDAWRELIEGGIRTARVQGAGVFKDQAADETVRGLFFAGTIRNWQIVIPDFGTIEGPFHIAGLDYAGEHNGEATYQLSLESAGALGFTAA